MKSKNKERKGFTLIELLATIVILAVVLTISGYLITNVIKNSRKRTYEVTISEIEKNANSYITENADRLSFVEDKTNKDIEYQCVTVQNLIDYGYLKKNVVDSPVNENKNVDKADYVYLERNARSKAITKSIYLIGSALSKYGQKCNVVVSGKGDIDIKVEAIGKNYNGWSKEKKITIEYNVKNFNDVAMISEFEYWHNYTDNEHGKNWNEQTIENGHKSTGTAISNGEVVAKITRGNIDLAEGRENVDKIDNVGPVIKVESPSSGTFKKNVTIRLKATDYGSGVVYSSFEKNDIVVTIGGINITNFTLDNKNNGFYDLKITDYNNKGKVKIFIGKNKVKDYLDNWNNDITLDTNIEFDNTYQVKYDANGGSTCNPNSKTVTYNKAYGTLCTTTKVGHTFDNWYTTKTGGDKITSTTIVKNSNDHTIYAHWKAKEYTVKFDCNGGSKQQGKLGDMTAIYGKTFTMPSDVCMKKGYTQTTWKDPTNKNWNSSWSGIWKYDNGQYGITNNVLTLKAEWKVKTYTVKFNCNDGSKPAGKLGNMTIKYGETFTMPSDVCMKKGYTQTTWKDPTNKNWNSSWSGTWKYDNGDYGISNNVLTLNADWKAKTYTVKFDCNEGKKPSGKLGDKTATYGKTFTMPSDLCTRDGYTQITWKDPTNKNWNSSWSGTWNYDNGDYGINNNTLTLKAEWENKIVVTYDSNGGSACNPNTKNVKYNEKYGTLCSTSWTGNDFLGWYTEKNGGSVVTKDTKVTNKNNHTLYAHWKPKPVEYTKPGCYEYTVSASGNYKIEAWGAEGGKPVSLSQASNISSCQKKSSNFNYGYGAYTTGQIYFESGDKLVVCVGGAGSVASSSQTKYTPGGFNGGGGAIYGGGTGGGATDIRYFGKGPVDTNWYSTNGLAARIMVAGGGGGGLSSVANTGPYAGGWNIYSYGGAGGTTSGMSNQNFTPMKLPYGMACSLTSYDFNGQGGTQTSGGNAKSLNLIGAGGAVFDLGTAYWNAGFGYGSYADFCKYAGSVNSTKYAGGGGGGGYYGGSSGACPEHAADHTQSDMSIILPAGGGGGSSFISGHSGCKAITSSSNIKAKNDSYHYSGKYFTNTEMTAGVKTGNGKASITFVN